MLLWHCAIIAWVVCAAYMARRPSAQHAPAYRHVCDLLRQMRTDAGLTQQALAERLDMDQTLIHRSESGGRRLTPIEFAQWARACDADPSTVFTRLLEMAGI